MKRKRSKITLDEVKNSNKENEKWEWSNSRNGEIKGEKGEKFLTEVINEALKKSEWIPVG